MPLRDHFHPPVTLRHSWDELHGGWPMKIVEWLLPNLPANYVAAPQIHLGGAVEIDVATFEHDSSGAAAWSANGDAGRAVAVWEATEPTLRVETDLPDLDEYEVRVYDVTRGRRLVAAVELVSPSDRDRPETRQAFVAKCAALLRQQVSVTIANVVTVRESNLYADLLTLFGERDPSAGAAPAGTYAVTARDPSAEEVAPGILVPAAGHRPGFAAPAAVADRRLRHDARPGGELRGDVPGAADRIAARIGP
jgi:hypothetical protein